MQYDGLIAFCDRYINFFGSILKLLLADFPLFSTFQLVLFGLVAFAYYKDWLEKHEKGVILSIKRGEKTITLFYAFYLGLTGVIVASILAIEITEGYRLFWVTVDTLAFAYVCLLNKWGRNNILRGAQYIEKLEENNKP